MSASPLIRDVILRDGSTLRLRSPGLGDREAIGRFFSELTLESRYLRFHGAGNVERAARHYAEADGWTRVALLGHLGERVVAVAGYERLRELGAAEVAFAVLDELQDRGIGTRMLEQLAEIAAREGLERFDAEVLVENRRMTRVLEHAGFAVRRQGMGGEMRLSLDIRPTERLAERIAERDHVATVASLLPVLTPRSVAVVGASNAPGSVGGAILRGLIAGGFAGAVTPVNRSAPVVGSVRAVARVSDLAEPPDLVLVAVPAPEVIEVAADAAAAGVRALVVLSAGFSDRDDAAGRELEDELLATVRAAGMRLVGPNSLGVLNLSPDVRLRGIIGRAEPGPGGVAISSQSGALGIALLGQAAGRGLGVAGFVSLGNRADVSTNDMLEAWEEDERVAVVVMYVESFGNPRRFAQIARRVARRKPIVAVKGARAAAAPVQAVADPADPPTLSHGLAEVAGTRAAQALRGEVAVDILFRQSGVLRVDGTPDLFAAAAVLEREPLPGGRRVAVVTNSGGLGTLAADACLTRGLGMATLSAVTRGRLTEALPRADRVGNPVDMGIAAEPEDYRAALAAVLADDGVDAAIALYADLSGRGPEAVLGALPSAPRVKPVVASIVGADGVPPIAGPASPPNLRFPEECASALALAAGRREWLSRPLGQPAAPEDVDRVEARRVIDARLEEEGPGWLPPEVVRDLLDAGGIAHDLQPGAGRLARDEGDVLVAGVGHPSLGLVLATGASGGEDLAFHVAPLTDLDADELAADRPGLRDLVVRLGILLEALPEVAEAELDPVAPVAGGGWEVHGAEIRLAPPLVADRVKTW